MVSFGSKALPCRRPKDYTFEEENLICEQGVAYNHGKRRRMGRRGNKKQSSSDGGYHSQTASGGVYDSTGKDGKFTKKREFSEPEASYIRQQVDPETAKYYSEIANVLDSAEVDLEERAVICGNALEESSGKEVELATDHIISHTIQSLLEGCDADHLCSFLRSSAKKFPRIATDRCGSHVAETALRSLAYHLLDDNFRNLIKDTLALICQAMVQKPIDVMCNCHGSHVIRSLLCLCKGVPLDSEFRDVKSSNALARRLNLKPEREHKSDTPDVHQGFPDLLEFLVSEMLKCSSTDIAVLQLDQYSSLVLQTALKLLGGQEQELFHIIPLIMGCNVENAEEGGFLEGTEVQNIRDLMQENAFSHLMEVILDVAPDTLYDEIFMKIFKGSLYDISCHYSANFAVQALISHARSQSQIDAIGEEIVPKVKDLIEMGRSGVVASLVAACQRLHAYEHKCSKALAASVSLANESSPKFIVPRLLMLESYFFSNDKSNWSWTSGNKIHVMGSLILQSLYKYPNEYIQPYIISITSMENSHVLEAAKNTAGARVIEAFLFSSASDKQKNKLITKLKGHFGELALLPSGSFTVEKCFNASDVQLREAIVSELVSVQKELQKTKQGPLLLRNLDVDGYARRPEQWVSRQKSKLSFHREFLAEFGDEGSGYSKRKAPQQTNVKQMREEIDNVLSPFTGSETSSKKHKKQKADKEDVERKPSLDKKKQKHHHNDEAKATQQANIKAMRQEIDNVLSSFPGPETSKKHKKKKAGKTQCDESVERKSSSDKKKRKHHHNDEAKSPQKKLKT